MSYSKPWKLLALGALIMCATGLATGRCSVAATAVGRAEFVEDKDGENALELEDYSRAEKIYSSRLTSKDSGAQEGYLRTCLGEALLFQGRFAESGKQLKRAFSIIDKSQPPSSDLRARILDDMSWFKEAQGDGAAAADYCKQAINVLRSLHDADSNHLCELLEHLAALDRTAGLYAEAAGFYKEVVAIRIKTQGEQNPQTADAKERLAELLRLSGDTTSANALYAQAMQVKWNLPALFSPYTPHPYTETVSYHFYPGVSNCTVSDQLGPQTETISIAGVTVSAALAAAGKELGKNCCVNVALVNDASRKVQLLPKPPMLIELAPKVVLSHMVDPAALANKVENKGQKSAKWVRFWGADATQPVTSTYIGHPGVWGFPPVTSYNGVAPMISTSGNMTTITTQVPDYVAQARALQKAAAIEQRSRAQASAIRNTMLSANTVPPGGDVSGALYFDAVDPKKAILQLPVGNAVFEFEFPPGQ